ncbi:brevican core protein-like [Pecten maximus]|uniref:brevican core protein-like n=1 Tax=Pecten maximus TaxID=6579 RepID=UPI0014586AD7|nr:brevican core protein-like [Pecten maximus]
MKIREMLFDISFGITMCNVILHFLILTQIPFLKTVLFVDGHGMCASSEHDDMDSNKFYTSFMRLDTIGVLQCIKVCKRYKLCEKIHHNREQLTCDLMMPFEEKGNETSLLDVQSVKTNSSSCDSCSETEACIDTKNGSHVCLAQDPCPNPDWVRYNRKCYFFPGSEMLADDGAVFCNSMNATLVRIDNDEVHNFLISEMTKRGMTSMWIAANDRALEGHFVWGPGDVVLNARWKPGQPNDINNQDCVALGLQTQTWNDLECTTHYEKYAVCEVRYTMFGPFIRGHI